MGIENRGFASHPENIFYGGSRPNPFKQKIREILFSNAEWLDGYLPPGMLQAEKMTALEAVVRNCVRMAAGKNNSRAIEALRFLAEYSVGKPAQSVDVTVSQVQDPYSDLSEDELREEMRRLDGDLDEDTFESEEVSDGVYLVRGKLEDTKSYTPVVPDKKQPSSVDSEVDSGRKRIDSSGDGLPF